MLIVFVRVPLAFVASGSANLMDNKSGTTSSWNGDDARHSATGAARATSTN